jgi:allantoin racemase
MTKRKLFGGNHPLSLAGNPGSRQAGRGILPALAAGLLVGTTALHAQDAPTGSGASPEKVIVLINPNSNETATQSMADLARAETEGVASVEGRSNTGAPPLLTTPEDMENAIAGVVEIGVEAAKDERTAVIIVAAFSDPGLEELRAEVNIPVFGIGEEVFHEAAENGRAFGIVTVTPDEGLIESFRQKAAGLGYEGQYRGTRVTPGDPTELVQSPEKLDAALAEAVRQSVEEDGAEAVIMGGGPLSASAIRLQPQFDVPLVVAVSAAARAAAEAAQQSK